jgi:hypothetical protein
MRVEQSPTSKCAVGKHLEMCNAYFERTFRSSEFHIPFARELLPINCPSRWFPTISTCQLVFLLVFQSSHEFHTGSYL